MLAKLISLIPTLLTALHSATSGKAEPKPTAHPAYLAAAGLIGLAVYQFTQGDVPGAIKSALTGLGLAGVLHGLSDDDTASTPPAAPAVPN